MMTKIKLAHVNEIPEGKSIIVSLPSKEEIALYKVDGEVYALDNLCPHMGGPLGEGDLCGHTVTCPWHGWEFDIRNGLCVNMPGDDAKSIRICVEDDIVYLY